MDIVPVHEQGAVGRADENPVVIYLAGLSAGSRRTMRQVLDCTAGVPGNDL